MGHDLPPMHPPGKFEEIDPLWEYDPGPVAAVELEDPPPLSATGYLVLFGALALIMLVPAVTLGLLMVAWER